MQNNNPNTPAQPQYIIVQSPEPPKKKAKLMKTVIIVVSILLGVAALIAGGSWFIVDLAYRSGVKCAQEERYPEALEWLDGLDGYKDSTAQIRQCWHDYAMQLADNGEYLESLKVIEENISAADGADELMDDVSKRFIDELCVSGEYEKAVAVCDMLSDKGKANELKKRITYTGAVADYDSGRFAIAKDSFAKLADYENSEAYLVLCRYQEAVAAAELFGYNIVNNDIDDLFDDLTAHIDFDLCREALASEYFTLYKLYSAGASWSGGDKKIKIGTDSTEIDEYGKPVKVDLYSLELLNFWSLGLRRASWIFMPDGKLGYIAIALGDSEDFEEYLEFVEFDDPTSKYPKTITVKDHLNGDTYKLQSLHKDQ